MLSRSALAAGGQRLFLPELVLIHGLRRLTVKARASAQRATMAQLDGWKRLRLKDVDGPSGELIETK